MKYLLTILLVFIIACNSSPDNQISIKTKTIIRTSLTKKIEETKRILRQNDSLYRLYQKELFQTLNEQIELKDEKHEVYRYFLNRPFSQVPMLFCVENINQDFYLIIKIYNWSFNTKSNRDTLFSTSTKRILEKDWFEFKRLLEKANFWEMKDVKRKWDGFYDGYSLSLEAYIPSPDTTLIKKHGVCCDWEPEKTGYFWTAFLKIIKLYGFNDIESMNKNIPDYN
jgi:hypothetical protein